MISVECFAGLTQPYQLKAIYEALLSVAEGTAGLGIPAHDYIEINYVGSTNNIDTVAYKTGGSAGTIVATLTMAYVGGVPATDDALLNTVTKS